MVSVTTDFQQIKTKQLLHNDLNEALINDNDVTVTTEESDLLNEMMHRAWNDF